MSRRTGVLMLLALAVLLLGLDSWAKGPIVTLAIIAVSGMLIRNEGVIAEEFGKLTQPGGPA